MIQRVVNRARVLLALDRGERIVEIVRWLAISRASIWYLWQRYLERGVEPFLMKNAAVGQLFFPSLERVNIERVACTDPHAYGLELTRWDCRTLGQVVIGQAIVESIHYTTVARILASATLQPHRSRYWKTATIDEEFVSRGQRFCGATSGFCGFISVVKWLSVLTRSQTFRRCRDVHRHSQ